MNNGQWSRGFPFVRSIMPNEKKFSGSLVSLYSPRSVNEYVANIILPGKLHALCNDEFPSVHNS